MNEIKTEIKKDITALELRPRINSAKEVKALADDLRSTPTALVNFIVDTGIEVLTRGKQEIKRELVNNLKRALGAKKI